MRPMMNRKTAYFIAFMVIFAVALAGVWGPGFAAGMKGSKSFFKRADHSLSFYNTHTRETLTVDYRPNRRLVGTTLGDIDHFLRDHRNGHKHEISRDLLDLLYDMKVIIQARYPDQDIVYHVISGYRSPQTNASLRAAGGGQAKNSRHMHGDAIDVRVPDVPSKELRNVAWCLNRGGVGWYGGSNFIHVDTDKVRHWNWNPRGLRCSDYNS